MIRQRLRWAATLLSLAIAAAVLLIVWQHDFEMVEQPVAIPTKEGVLRGILTMPEKPIGKVGLVVFVHGDGPADASYDGFYKPLWEAFAKAGYASLSLSKPGIGGSDGSWLNQSMEDRAEETLQALRWAKRQAIFDARRIGLWGASQAGWVIPSVVEQDREIAFSILVAPAINWLSQGAYHTRQQMKRDGFAEADIRERLALEERVNLLLQKGASYEAYARIVKHGTRMTRERWQFVARNFRSDATPSLSSFRSPVHLVLGGQDLNVDVAETERVYRQRVAPGLLSVTRLPEADHAMLTSANAASELRATFYAVFFPRKLFDPGYFDDLASFVQRIGE
ncbi:alpha/beta hydrolase family protein [Paenibacillus xanthanilyticus]|uniref:Alpha/beta hydrolase family protein n=1 Tax=Paenibacillus xanthanilyticus TaxID=1783531 RepID=A0ABV8K1Y7_9BACL